MKAGSVAVAVLSTALATLIVLLLAELRAPLPSAAIEAGPAALPPAAEPPPPPPAPTVADPPPPAPEPVAVAAPVPPPVAEQTEMLSLVHRVHGATFQQHPTDDEPLQTGVAAATPVIQRVVAHCLSSGSVVLRMSLTSRGGRGRAHDVVVAGASTAEAANCIRDALNTAMWATADEDGTEIDVEPTTFSATR
jgi:hypothetical protein